MHGLTPRLHGSPTCLPGPSLLYCDHGPRSPSSLSAAVTSGTGRAALFLPSNALVSRVSPRCGYDMPQQRRRRCRASQGMKKGRRPRRRPRLKLSDRAGPDQCPVPGENALFPAQIAGFLAVSRPVPVYPVFLNYVVPVQPPSAPEVPPEKAGGHFDPVLPICPVRWKGNLHFGAADAAETTPEP